MEKGEPAKEPGDGAHPGTHGPDDCEAVPSGLWHRRGHLYEAHHAGNGKKPREKVGKHDRGPRPGVGEPRKDEEPGADHRVRRDAEHIKEPKLFFQLHKGVSLRFLLPVKPSLQQDRGEHSLLVRGA